MGIVNPAEEAISMSFIRLALASSLVLALTACGGSGGIGNILGPIGQNQCDTGTQVQLANPQPSQTGVSTNIGQITIVASGNNNALGNSYGQWYLTLTGPGGSIQGSNLTPVDGRAYTHPYTSDYYYGSSFGQLPAGVTWTVYLNEQNANCSPVPLQSFST